MNHNEKNNLIYAIDSDPEFRHQLQLALKIEGAIKEYRHFDYEDVKEKALEFETKLKSNELTNLELLVEFREIMGDFNK